MIKKAEARMYEIALKEELKTWADDTHLNKVRIFLQNQYKYTILRKVDRSFESWRVKCHIW